MSPGNAWGRESRTKAIAKGGREGLVQPIDFLYNFLKSKFGVPTAIAEFGYLT